MAEIELSVPSPRFSSRLLGGEGRVAAEVEAWEAQRGEGGARVHWRVTAQDARVGLGRLCLDPA
jgi:hypothetical protein